ncbi:hypothetical protein CALVIDRAFT_536030 [Calocera viscosa TUFC12733]|uniref:Uncharacterized protein n=1 Tax=Calocera viscosa (strain TUFC12733) TaxID=1330018 RepID=A0A167NPL4_CALVF|nr:hypothetical protein CALVIDRAFT_536030 [Calocera viscosa TUFC12733]
MYGKLTSLALLSLVASAQAAAIPRRLRSRDVDASAVVEILSDGTATASALLPGDDVLAHAIVARDGSNPLDGILGLVVDGLLNTIAGLLLVTNPDTSGSATQAQYVMAASANQSTPLFLVPDASNTTAEGSPSGKTLVTIHIPILDQTSGQMVDSCLTYDQNPVASSTLAAVPCAPDADHASQRFMYDSSTGIVEPMFDSTDEMDLATQTPSYVVNAASIDGVSAPSSNSSNVLIVFTPATDSVPMSTAALPLSRVAVAGVDDGTSATADDGSASATADGVTASTTGDDSDSDAGSDSINSNDQMDQTDTSANGSGDEDDDSTLTDGDMPTEMAAAKQSSNKADDCDESYVDEQDD